jgi:hypothetical protein
MATLGNGRPTPTQFVQPPKTPVPRLDLHMPPTYHLWRTAETAPSQNIASSPEKGVGLNSS